MSNETGPEVSQETYPKKTYGSVAKKSPLSNIIATFIAILLGQVITTFLVFAFFVCFDGYVCNQNSRHINLLMLILALLMLMGDVIVVIRMRSPQSISKLIYYMAIILALTPLIILVLVRFFGLDLATI